MSDVRWSLTQRLVRALLALPDWFLLRLLGPPVERDGRVLDRHTQLLLAFADRTGRLRRDLAVAPMRRELATLSRLGMPRFPSVDASDRSIDGPGGPIPLRVYRAAGASGPVPAIVYFHGGGWVCGNVDSHDSSCRRLAMLSSCVVVSVDYRLAPEHPWPGAVDDALAAYAWVQKNPGDLAIVPGHVGVMGDSAGGNLAAVVSLAARDGGLPLPVAQGLIYPAVDMEFTAASHASVGAGFGLEQRTMHWFREQYVPDSSRWRETRVSPLHAADLTGLPPALVVTAGFDPLRDEGDAYAEALRRAGTPVRHLRYDGMIHGFFGMGILPGGLERAAEICTAMGELMQRPA